MLGRAGPLPNSVGGLSMIEIGGRAYPFVRIGNQLWITENLDYQWTGLTVGASGTSSSGQRANYCDNDAATYGVTGNKYGLLYNWIAVKYLEDNKATLLPSGWHVPTAAEWDVLATTVGSANVAGTKLKSTIDWSSDAGTDDYDFSALPTGYYYGVFGGLGSKANFWTATESSSATADYRGFSTGAAMDSYTPNKADQYSIRLVKTIT